MSDWQIEQTGEPWVPEAPEPTHGSSSGELEECPACFTSWDATDEQPDCPVCDSPKPRARTFSLPDRDGYTLGDPKLVTLGQWGL